MCKDASKRMSGQSLFRKRAVSAVGQRLFGTVIVITPPSSRLASAVAALAMLGLGAVTYFVEVPQRSRAVGVLMPAGGLVDIVASHAGQVSGVFVSEGQLLEQDNLLVTTRDGTSPGENSAPEAHLRSLRDELKLLHEAHSREQEISAGALVALQEESASATMQLRIVEERVASHRLELAVRETRFLRWQQLVDDGHVSRDAFQIEQANLIGAKTEHVRLRQERADYLRAIQALAGSRTQTEKQLELNSIQHALNVERLKRDIEFGQFKLMQEFRAPYQAVVVQVLVRRGDTVRPGQVLAKLRRPGDRLQAWLYLPASTARLPAEGQIVEITLDAYPREVYGTHAAVVSSISGSTLLPKDIRAPLILSGPVFEVIADLDEYSVTSGGARWPLSPGISFSADIIQRRMHLYEWFFRALSGGPAND